MGYETSGNLEYFSAPMTADYKGWVIVVRSPKTGRIIETASSLHHLTKYVTQNIPEVAKFKVDVDAIRSATLKEIETGNK